MGFGGISIWQLLIILAIVLLLFGTKRLRNLGSDLGNAFKGFKRAMDDGESKKEPEKLSQDGDEDIIEGVARREESDDEKVEKQDNKPG